MHVVQLELAFSGGLVSVTTTTTTTTTVIN